MPLSRRHFLGGAAGLAGAAGLSLASPGVRGHLFGPPQPPHPVPQGEAGEVVKDRFTSAALGQEVRYAVAYPAAVVRDLPVLVELHGRGGDYRAAFEHHHLDAFLADQVRQGLPPFAVVAVDGGDHSYYHPRADGTDAQRMVLEELLPRLAARGLRTDRFAVGGWSMGGYGALLLAEKLGSVRVAACVVDAPAIVRRWQDSAQGAFDSPADFERHDVLGMSSRLSGIPTRVTCGTSDPFIGGVRELVRRAPQVQHLLGPGGHDLAWWMHAAPSQLAFAGRHLAQAAT
jgi:pimeloyl-ACP methyl ester carboxylesterase